MRILDALNEFAYLYIYPENPSPAFRAVFECNAEAAMAVQVETCAMVFGSSLAGTIFGAPPPFLQYGRLQFSLNDDMTRLYPAWPTAAVEIQGVTHTIELRGFGEAT